MKVNKGNIMAVINPNGDQFLVRIVNRNDNFGLDWKLTHKEDDPLVEFYDMDYTHTVYGQFVSRYYMSTLLEDVDYKNGWRGLCLYGSSDKWNISTNNMQKIWLWLDSKVKG